WRCSPRAGPYGAAAPMRSRHRACGRRRCRRSPPDPTPGWAAPCRSRSVRRARTPRRAREPPPARPSPRRTARSSRRPGPAAACRGRGPWRPAAGVRHRVRTRRRRRRRRCRSAERQVRRAESPPPRRRCPGAAHRRPSTRSGCSSPWDRHSRKPSCHTPARRFAERTAPTLWCVSDNLPDRATRASDADRERVVDLLRDAASDGRLDLDEFEERMTAAYRARTYGELDPLTKDLPDVTTATPKQELTLRAQGSSVRREGRWAVPRRLVVEAKHGGVRLDLTKAVVLANEVEVAITAAHASVRIIVPPG